MSDSKRDGRTANRRSFRADSRAIEGLPVRLVIALVVGVASLSVMMGMIGDIEGLAATEVDAQPQPEVTTPGEQSIDVSVIDPDGGRVADATVLVRSGSAQIDGVATAETNEEGVATVDVAPELGPNQPDGTLTVDVKPPAEGDYVDERENTAVLVVEE
ncbi:carboxypeptidase regulatory-like domain-containing protein [Halorubrum rutilum]|uniref:Carboxypeptidase regulatory-like domain-containing protein n=1 Tax=Halorubrum rutilum TaxID=1364933 RepID=A0ABD6AMR0_9EURY|nr:carboxypeptidase regulatory-like domain-containing protein [Halorubrum rutilum]